MIRRATHLALTNPPYERNIHGGGRHGVDARARIANAAPHRRFGGGRGRRTPGGEIGVGPGGAIAGADRPPSTLLSAGLPCCPARCSGAAEPTYRPGRSARRLVEGEDDRSDGPLWH